MKVYLIVAARSSSWWNWDPKSREVIRLEEGSDWGEPESALALGFTLGANPHARILITHARRYTPDIVRALRTLGASVIPERAVEVRKTHPTDAASIDPAEGLGLENLSVPTLERLESSTMSLPQALDLLERAFEGPASEDEELPAQLRQALDGLATGLAEQAAPSTVSEAHDTATSDEEGPAAPELPLPPKGRSVRLWKGELERLAGQQGAALDWPAYLQRHAEALYANLPHPSWLAELEAHAPRAEAANDDNDNEEI